MDSNETEVKPPGEKAAELPDHGTFYYKSFWGAYKGHVRGLLRGLLIGAIAGAAVGMGLAALSGIGLFVGIIGAGGLGIGALIATFTGVGAIFGAELMGKIGNSAGNAAAQFAESEMRLRYPSLPEVAPNSPAPGIGHHFEIPPDGDEKFFHRHVAIPGLLVGTAIGALLAFGSHGAGIELLSETGSHLFAAAAGTGAATATVATAGHATATAAAHTAATATATAVATHGAVTATQIATIGAGGLMGASFGINRGKFKTLFNYTDNLLMGKMSGPSKDQIARDRARYKTQDPENPYVITGAQRYDEYQRLLTGYYKKSFDAGWSGDRRGFLGGIVAGTLSGLAAGALGCAALVALGVVSGGTIAPFFPVILSLCAALGGKQGMNIFSDAGREPAAFSVTREIFDERVKSLKTGQDITFDEAEDRARKRVTLHPDMDPPGTENRTWFNWKIGVIGLLAGAVVGAVLAPIAAVTLTHLFGIHIAAWSMGAVASIMPISIATFSLAGGTFGMGDKTMDRLHETADKIFMGTFFPGHSVHDHKTGHDYPPLAPDSPLLQKAQPAPAPAPVTPAPNPAVAVASVEAPDARPLPYIRDILATPPVEGPPPKPVAKDTSFIMRKIQETDLIPGGDAVLGRV